MSYVTRGLGGPVHQLNTAGLGVWAVYVIPEEEYDTGAGGAKKQFREYQVVPRRIWLRKKVGEPTIRLADIRPERADEALKGVTEVVIEGEPYLVAVGPEPTPKQALEMLPPHELEAKIEAVKAELGVVRAEAIKALKVRAKKEIKAAKEYKATLVRDDEEFILLLILSEV